MLLAERKHQNGRSFWSGQLASAGVFALPAGERRDHIRNVGLCAHCLVHVLSVWLR
jgi:hypothetical protein